MTRADLTISEADAYAAGREAGTLDWRASIARIRDDMLRTENQLTALAMRLAALERANADGLESRGG
jgi:hypothetical protein